MRDYGRITPQFWIGDYGRKLRGKPNLQVVLMYMITSPNANMIGLYYLPTQIMAHETGVPLQQVEHAILFLHDIEVAHYDSDRELVYLPWMAKDQIGSSISEKNINMITGVLRLVDAFEGHPFALDFVSRYNDAYHLGRSFEAPSRGLASVSVVASEGAGVGDLFSTRPLRDQDQETAQEQETASAARAPAHARSNQRAKIWTAWDWLQEFGAAWRVENDGLTYGNNGDTRSASLLADTLARLPEAELVAAQKKAPEMFAEFLSRTDPKTVERRHPFAFFVTEWGGLRAPKLKVAAVETFAERDRRIAAERAEKDRLRGEAERRKVDEKLAELRKYTPPTEEQQREITSLVAELAAGKAVAG